MKNKSLVLSLIFPIICAVGVTVLVLVHFIKFYDILAVVMEVSGIFPLISVIFLKTDISGLLKWQIIFTAAAAGSLLLYILLVISGQLFAGMFVFGILVPAALIAASGAIYGVKLKKEEGRRALKWFTAFFSTPAVYYGVYFLAAFTMLFIYGLGSFAHFG